MQIYPAMKIVYTVIFIHSMHALWAISLHVTCAWQYCKWSNKVTPTSNVELNWVLCHTCILARVGIIYSWYIWHISHHYKYNSLIDFDINVSNEIYIIVSHYVAFLYIRLLHAVNVPPGSLVTQMMNEYLISKHDR